MANLSYLKWVGSKAQVANTLIDAFPNVFNRFLEPFFGSGSMSFAYTSSQAPRQDDCFSHDVIDFIASDSNPFLMNCHRIVKDRPKELESRLKEIEEEYLLHNDKKKYYYDKRQQVTDMSLPPLDLAAIFIFINKTCFNGIWRLNSKGKNNVPWNKREEFNMPISQVRVCSEWLNQYFSLYCQDFEEFIHEHVSDGDFVFLDPPYIPLNATSSFTSYTIEGWSDIDDERLVDSLKYIHKKNAFFMMTNSTSPKVFELFNSWNISFVDVHRFVRAIRKTDIDKNRQKIKETVITNY